MDQDNTWIYFVALRLAVLCLCWQSGFANIIRVPSDFATIQAAVDSSVRDDTVLVDRGRFSERLFFRWHRVHVMSWFPITNDSLDLFETIIDATNYAEMDTATVVWFDSTCEDSATLSGFVLTGGHGFLSTENDRHAGAFVVNGTSPVIRCNIISDNNARFFGVGNIAYSHGWLIGNRIQDNRMELGGLALFGSDADSFHFVANEFGPNPSAMNATLPGLIIHPGSAFSIVGNRFADLTGNWDVAILIDSRHGEISNNLFERIVGLDENSTVVSINECNIDFNDNIFRDIQVAGASAVFFDGRRNPEIMLIGGNLFENVQSSFYSCIQIQNYRGTMRNNIFRRCTAPYCGGISISNAGVTVPFLFEFNVFELCSARSLGIDRPAGALRIGYQEPISAHHNIFSGNFPGAVDRGDFPDPPISRYEFQDNYWGDPSGPYNAVSNPGGLGDAVGDSIHFMPWAEDSVFSAQPERPSWQPEKATIIAFPNPFNSQTRVRFQVEQPGSYAVSMYNIQGRKIADIWSGVVVIERELSVNSADLASGVYILTLSREIKEIVAVSKLVVLH